MYIYIYYRREGGKVSHCWSGIDNIDKIVAVSHVYVSKYI